MLCASKDSLLHSERLVQRRTLRLTTFPEFTIMMTSIPMPSNTASPSGSLLKLLTTCSNSIVTGEITNDFFMANFNSINLCLYFCRNPGAAGDSKHLDTVLQICQVNQEGYGVRNKNLDLLLPSLQLPSIFSPGQTPDSVPGV